MGWARGGPRPKQISPSRGTTFLVKNVCSCRGPMAKRAGLQPVNLKAELLRGTSSHVFTTAHASFQQHTLHETQLSRCDIFHEREVLPDAHHLAPLLARRQRKHSYPELPLSWTSWHACKSLCGFRSLRRSEIISAGRSGSSHSSNLTARDRCGKCVGSPPANN